MEENERIIKLLNEFNDLSNQIADLEDQIAMLKQQRIAVFGQLEAQLSEFITFMKTYLIELKE